MSFDAIATPVVGYYEECLRRHGPTARGVDWKDDDSQRLRFEVLTGVVDLEGRSVHDVGAGVGHLYEYLVESGVGADYSGSDRSAAMVECARRGHPGVPFECRDILADPPRRTYDVLVCSGLFHVKLDAPPDRWRDFVFAMIARMFALCSVAISFNLMSRHVDFESGRLYHADPGEVLEHCLRELSPHVVLRHDYPLYEFTAYVYRGPRG